MTPSGLGAMIGDIRPITACVESDNAVARSAKSQGGYATRKVVAEKAHGSYYNLVMQNVRGSIG